MRKAMFLLAVFGLAGALWAADPHIGTWKLNIAKSTFSGPAPKSATETDQAQKNGLKVVGDRVNADGTVSHTEFAVKYDGKDYPIKGIPTVDTIALKKIDANTFEAVAKKDGKVVGTLRQVFSKDGKIRTSTTKGKNEQGQDFTTVSVMEKQ